MANTATFSVLNAKVQKIFSDENVETLGMAFEILCLRTLFKLNDEEIEEALTDNGHDGEVDAIYISERVVHLMTFKYTDDPDQTIKNYPGTEIDQFAQTVDAIIGRTLDRRTINTAVWDKYEEIKTLITTGKVEYKIYVVSNKLPPVSSSKVKLSNIIDEYQIIEKPIYLTQDDLVAKILENRTEKISGSLHFIHRQYFEKSEGNLKTVIGAISANDLIALIKDPHNNAMINEHAFNENVRRYKPKHRVNLSMIETATGIENYQFFYLNNGITILCKKIDYPVNTPSPLVTIENFQIINGGQTSHSLFEVYKANPDKLNTVELLIRICQVLNENPDEPISQKISETTNNQIPVGNRDLHSNDDVQRKLEEEFLTLGYFYECKPNKYMDEPKDKVLNNELLGQLYMAYHLDMPSEAKNNKSKVFADAYDLIFDEEGITAVELLRLYKLYLPLLKQKKAIQQKKRKKERVAENEAFISRATFHILNGTKYLFEKEENYIEASKRLTKPEKKLLKQNLHDSMGDRFTKKAIKMVFEVVKKEMKIRGKNYTHDKFFKEIPTNNIIRTHILKKIEKNKPTTRLIRPKVGKK